jgi:hypothetical protein
MRNITSVKYTWPERIEDADIKDVVAQLLTAAPSKRLGCRAGNAKDVKKHAFFAKVRALVGLAGCSFFHICLGPCP